MINKSKNNSNSNKLQASQQVNRIGKYLFKHIDGAYNYKTSSNMFDVYFFILFQLKEENRLPGITNYDMQEMHIDLNITTYQNKIRINLIEISPDEKTIGYDLFYPDELADLPSAYTKIVKRIHSKLSKYYKDYDFIY